MKPTIQPLTELDVKAKISAYVLSLLNEGWILVDSLTVNGDWYPRLQFKRNNELKEVKVLSYYPAPRKLQDNGETIFEVYEAEPGVYAETQEDWVALLKNKQK